MGSYIGIRVDQQRAMPCCSEDMEHGASCCSAPHLQSPRACDAAVRISQGDVKEAAQKVGFADAESFHALQWKRLPHCMLAKCYTAVVCQTSVEI